MLSYLSDLWFCLFCDLTKRLIKDFRPPYRKMAIISKNNDPKEPKLCDFSYISMTNPPIPFLGLKMVKKGVSRAFLLSAVPISGSKNLVFSAFIEAK